MHYPHPATTTTGRRGFLARLSAAAAAFAATGAAASSPALAASSIAQPGDDALEPWLRDLRGRKHRQLFYSHDKLDGAVLWQARLFYELYEKTYGVPASQLGVVMAAHGPSGGMLFNDMLWSKYELGKMYKVTMRDPNPAPAAPDTAATTTATAAAAAPGASGPNASATSAPAAAPAAAAPQRPPRIPATRNVFTNPQTGDPVDARNSIEALRELGATFLLCGNALSQFANYTARKSNTTPEVAYQELRANLVPGTVVVPTMIIAVNRAQEQGCSYFHSPS